MMTKLKWQEPARFTRAKLADSRMPVWVKPVLVLVIAAVMMSFPLYREKPLNGSWPFTVGNSFIIGIGLLYIIPFIGSRLGDLWVLTGAGIGMSGFRLIWLTNAFCRWKDMTGYSLHQQTVGGEVFDVLEVRLKKGGHWKGAVMAPATRAAVEPHLTQYGVPAVEPTAGG